MRSKTDRVICGTCEYWTGERNPVFDSKGIPKIDIIDQIGICQHPNSNFCDMKRKNNLNCIRYSKWTEIL